MLAVVKQFLEYTQAEPTVLDEHASAFFDYFSMFSFISMESFYVFDLSKNQFCYIKPDDLFLCGFSVEDALRQGDDFYRSVVYPEDLSLWVGMRAAMRRYLEKIEEKRDEVDFFSCTFRLLRNYFFLISPLPLMVNHRMKPVWEAGELRYLICSVVSSTSKEAGNLSMYYKEGLSYEEYNVTTKRWKRKIKESLSEREEAILLLAQQGKSAEEMAKVLCKGVNTIRNQIKALFLKLNVHSMQEAIEYACNYRVIYPIRSIEQSTGISCKRKRVLLTEDKLQRIRQCLSDGKSIREVARLEGVAESAIRYWKNKERLIK